MKHIESMLKEAIEDLVTNVKSLEAGVFTPEEEFLLREITTEIEELNINIITWLNGN